MNKLTTKQIGFCRDIVKNNMSLTQAYINNYNVSPKTKKASIRDMASKLKANPLITLTINKMLKEEDELNFLTKKLRDFRKEFKKTMFEIDGIEDLQYVSLKNRMKILEVKLNALFEHLK